MKYVEAPEEWVWHQQARSDRNSDRLFLAGGITGCWDWQGVAANVLADIDDLIVFNPRREDFPIGNPAEAFKQIKWEYDHLRQSTIVMFWFPSETLCPITLFELGAWLERAPYLMVGTHIDYARREDVIIQTQLALPDKKVYGDLNEMLQGLRDVLTDPEGTFYLT